MKQETKAIILVLLIVVLAVVAYFVLFQSKAGRDVAAFLPGATTTTVASKPKQMLPTPKEVALLKQWLGGQREPAPQPVVPFGLPSSRRPQSSDAASIGASSSPADPLRLDGIIKVGRTLKAVIGGDAYAAGQTVRYTSYAVVAVMADGVKIRSNTGQEQILVLQK